MWNVKDSITIKVYILLFISIFEEEKTYRKALKSSYIKFDVNICKDAWIIALVLCYTLNSVSQQQQQQQQKKQQTWLFEKKKLLNAFNTVFGMNYKNDCWKAYPDFSGETDVTSFDFHLLVYIANFIDTSELDNQMLLDIERYSINASFAQY